MLIYAHTSTTRLQYVCKFIFEEQLGTSYSITTHAESFNKHEGAKINYSDLPQEGSVFTLRNHPLLFQTGVQTQATDCFDSNGYKAFFKTTDSSFSFDIFAATFYLLSRYEEYLPHEKDMYGRYAYQNSLAFKERFLQQPLINYWLMDFAKSLLHVFPGLKLREKTFKFIPTYDIDIAWSFKRKGLLRNVGGFLKSPSIKRLGVLAGVQQDPFDSYDFLQDLHESTDLPPIFFFLVAISSSQYDKNISPFNMHMWRLIKSHARRYNIGLHPSWSSFEKPGLIQKEKKILETASKTVVTKSRQHYIKLELPDTYQHLLAAGITADYSMGYGSINGFRASVAASFLWYNLTSETITPLRLHPFCFMDANSFYEQKQNAASSLQELLYYYGTCKKLKGEMIPVFHNNFLGTDPLYAGWRKMYSEFIAQIRP